MFLTYDDLTKLFPDSKGVKDDFQFQIVATESTQSQPKGLFIPLYEDSGELKEAIGNGAIGAIWNKEVLLPAYIPSQFPVFFTNDLEKAIENILKTYVDQLNGEINEIMNKTKFLFREEKLLNKSFPSYYKPVLKIVSKMERRG